MNSNKAQRARGFFRNVTSLDELNRRPSLTFRQTYRTNTAVHEEVKDRRSLFTNGRGTGCFLRNGRRQFRRAIPAELPNEHIPECNPLRLTYRIRATERRAVLNAVYEFPHYLSGVKGVFIR